MDDTFIEAITYGVRFLSTEQISRTWCDKDRTRTIEFLTPLINQGFVSIETHLIHPELPILAPEFNWKPGSVEPCFRSVAYRLRSRWKQPKEEIELVFPTEHACQHFGGQRVRPRPCELSHDLHFAGVYLWWKENQAPLSDLTWVSGDSLRSTGRSSEFGESLPDAVLVDATDRTRTIMEGGGRYHRRKLESMHAEYQHLPYHVW